ncbi:MAG: hypothetical protein ACFFCS_12450 [Candidatus Hodarchaeota archaeon]
MKKKTYCFLSLALLATVLLASNNVLLASGASSIGVEGTLVLDSTAQDPLQFGVLYSGFDRYDVQVTSTGSGQFDLMNSDMLAMDVIASAEDNPLVDYPLTFSADLDGVSSPFDPRAGTKWIAGYNSTSTFNTAEVTLVQERIVLNPGEKKIVDTGSVVDFFTMELHLEAHTAYLLIADDPYYVLFNDFYLMSPRGIQLTYVGPSGMGGSPIQQYLLFVTKEAGMYTCTSRPSSPTGAYATVELLEIPEVPLTPGEGLTTGDDLLGTVDDAEAKSFTSYCFTMDVNQGDSFESWYDNYIASLPYPASVDAYYAQPYMNNRYYLSSYTSMRDFAWFTGKFMIIAIESDWHNLISHQVRMEKAPCLVAPVGTTKTHEVRRDMYQAIKITTTKDSIIRINSTDPPVKAVPSIVSLYRGFSNGPMVDYPEYVDLSSGDWIDRVYFMPKGNYYLHLDNQYTGQESYVTLTVTDYSSQVVGTPHVPWNPIYDNRITDDWDIFNSTTDFGSYHYTFMDSGTGAGDKVSRAFKFRVDDIAYLDLQLEILIGQNPTMNDGHDASGGIQYWIYGPNGFYPQSLASRLCYWDSTILSFNNLSPSSGRSLNSSSILEFSQKGDYYLVVSLTNWLNVSSGQPDPNPVKLSVRFTNHMVRVRKINYEIDSSPSVHAYGPPPTDDGYSWPKYLDFSSYNNNTGYDLQLKDFNGDKYNWGILLKVKGKALRVTQLIIEFLNASDLEDGSGPMLSNPAGVNVIYPENFWNLDNPEFINDYLDFNGAGTNYREGQFIDNGLSGYVSLEFGVYRDEFLLWINPNEVSGPEDFHQSILIQLHQYATPSLIGGKASSVDVEMPEDDGAGLSPEEKMAVSIVIPLVAGVAVAVLGFYLVDMKKAKKKPKKIPAQKQPEKTIKEGTGKSKSTAKYEEPPAEEKVEEKPATKKPAKSTAKKTTKSTSKKATTSKKS